MAQPFFGRRDAEPSTGSRPAHIAPPTPSLPAALQSSSASAPSSSSAAPRESAARLTVGPNIKLKGLEITDCDTLCVEGMVEATMKSRVIEIAEIGTFKGEAEIELAEIHGRFEGSLTVQGKLVIHTSGRVSGKIRYGRLVISEGGQLSGDVQVATGPVKESQPLSRVA
jgi:cytoskeletal protein CcmA (bactofilin family)